MTNLKCIANDLFKKAKNVADKYNCCYKRRAIIKGFIICFANARLCTKN
ncbi:hypothetical protein DESAMIL20_1094 [Desulfurella amilsii]|uniref:Uncharacterized protein n=1 Tax=Desulfurella amilsii TaxID=1562698 RepID=A0A1X4XVI1_9BACT|nr:hypothetical protein DESAMIL20_1094 [Desulfurella amilsii]